MGEAIQKSDANKEGNNVDRILGSQDLFKTNTMHME